MRQFLKKITHPFLKLGLQIFYLKPRKYTYEGIEVIVHPDVFPPHLTLSTKIFLIFLKTKQLDKKTVLELGCGSGILSLYASKKGAITTSSDINPIALKYLKKASDKNQLTLEIVQSDLFDDLKNRTFDYILINPPYYPKAPKNIKEKAWFCGSDFEYFKKLFIQLSDHINPSSIVYMILSEDCEIEHLKSLAHVSSLVFDKVLEKKVAGEKNYIFSIKRETHLRDNKKVNS
ncbi:methyltransferase [uncultured Aquimarina sp.]|uniref:methyltransferase n=1 Tax=uncultured Aquimarina sp. TaxID=575652 RepID=UPI0026371EAC|nr:methyltransferase [uncultured Aquimarina sp.]